MIANITSGNSFTGLVMYNEKKVHKGNAVRLSSYTIPLNSSSNQIINLLETVGNKNPNITNKTFHVSIAFAQNDRVDDNSLSKMADEYMKEMGFIDVPYMVYKHFDTGISHVHIVGTRINFDGQKINDSYEKYKSQRVSRKLELKYNLTVVPSVKDYSVTKEPTLNQDGTINTKHKISTAIYDILHHQKATNFEDFKDMLAKRRIVLDVVKKDTKGNNLITPGLMYSVGYKVTPETKRIKGSSFHQNYTYKNIIDTLNSNLLKENVPVLSGRSKEDLIKTVKKIIVELQSPSINTVDQFNLILEKHKLKANYLSNSGGIFGLKIVDLISNTEYKASDLNRAFSWNAIKAYLESKAEEPIVKQKEDIPFILNQPIDNDDKKITWVTSIPNKVSIAAPINRVMQSLSARGFVSQNELNLELKTIGYKAYFTRDLSQKGNEIQNISFTNIKTGHTYSGNKLDYKNLSWNILKDFIADDNAKSTFENYVNQLYNNWSLISNLKNENASDYLNYLNQYGVTITLKDNILCYKQLNGKETVNIPNNKVMGLYASLTALQQTLKPNGFNEFPLSALNRRFVTAIYNNDITAIKELIKNGNRIKLSGIKLTSAAEAGIKTYKTLVNTQSQISRTMKFVAFCTINCKEAKNQLIDFTTFVGALNKRGIGVSYDQNTNGEIANLVYFNKGYAGLTKSTELAKYLNEDTIGKLVNLTADASIKETIDNNNGFLESYSDKQIALINAIENDNEQQEIRLVSEGTFVKFTDEEIAYFDIDEDYFEIENIDNENLSKEVIEFIGGLISDVLQSTQGENPVNKGGPISKDKRKKPRYRRR